MWYVALPTLASDAPFTINHGVVSDTVLVDQTIDGSQWVSIGIYEFADDGTENITLSDNADSWIIADAVRFTMVEIQ